MTAATNGGGISSIINISDEEDNDGQSSENEDELTIRSQKRQQEIQQQQQLTFPFHSDIATNLFKWTNYINGWQERYIVLKEGVLSYYRSQNEVNYGCRGAITIKQCSIITHELDDCRFDIKVNDSVWYLRAKTVEDRQKWLDALGFEKRGNDMACHPSQASLKRHGSMQSINSTVSLSLVSADSALKNSFGLKEKLDEMETFKNILCKQIESLQGYFDACAKSDPKSFLTPEHHQQHNRDFHESVTDSDEENSGSSRKTDTDNNAVQARMRDHAVIGLEFKAEAYTFKATAAGILHELSHCIETMQQREDYWKAKVEKERDNRKRLEEKLKRLSEEKKTKIILAGPDFEEGPMCNTNEEFMDAIDTMLDTFEQEEERRVQAMQSLSIIPNLKPVSKHRLSEHVDKVVNEHLEYDLVDDLTSNVWELLLTEGEMRVYRRPLEDNGVTLDPLKAVHKVKGITAHELCYYFWDPIVRMEWEVTLDSSRVVEALSDDTLIFHQVHKRIWPTAQRDTCFWSNIRRFKKMVGNEEQSGWVCVNYSIEHDQVPVKDPIIRAFANVAMICTTTIIDEHKFHDKASIPRKNIICNITYVANVNPGGWVPAGVIRKAYKSVIPKVVKQFSQHVIDKMTQKPIMF